MGKEIAVAFVQQILIPFERKYLWSLFSQTTDQIRAVTVTNLGNERVYGAKGHCI